jgi:hypothetical protein
MKFTSISIGIVALATALSAHALTVTNSAAVDPSFPAVNSVDGSQSTFVNKDDFPSAGSYITYDLGSVQPLRSIAFSSRNSGFFATDSAVFPGASGNFAAIQTQASDDPNAVSGWTTLASSSFSINVSSASARLLLPSTVTNRYFRFLELGATPGAVQFAEMRANPRVAIIAGSSTAINDASFPLAQGADGNRLTFANISPASGSLTLDLGEYGLGGFTNLSIVARDVSANFMPSNITLRVSSTDNPASFDTILATTNFFLADVTAGGTNNIYFSNPAKRYVEFNWIGNVSGLGAGIQIAEFNVGIPEPSAALLSAFAACVVAWTMRRR